MPDAPAFGRRQSHSYAPIKSAPLVVAPRPETSERALPGLKELGFVTVDDGAELRAWKKARRQAMLRGQNGWRLGGFALMAAGGLMRLWEFGLIGSLLGGLGSLAMLVSFWRGLNKSAQTSSDSTA